MNIKTEPTPLRFARGRQNLEVVRHRTPTGMAFIGRCDGRIAAVADEAHVVIRMLLVYPRSFTMAATNG